MNATVTFFDNHAISMHMNSCHMTATVTPVNNHAGSKHTNIWLPNSYPSHRRRAQQLKLEQPNAIQTPTHSLCNCNAHC